MYTQKFVSDTRGKLFMQPEHGCFLLYDQGHRNAVSFQIVRPVADDRFIKCIL